MYLETATSYKSREIYPMIPKLYTIVIYIKVYIVGLKNILNIFYIVDYVNFNIRMGAGVILGKTGVVCLKNYPSYISHNIYSISLKLYTIIN